MVNRNPFGGKIFILVGDFRQTGPVIRYGTKAQVIDASLRKSNLWPLFNIERLSIPIRNAEDPEFATFVDTIGDGAGPEVTIPFVRTATSQADLIDFVWPEHILTQPELCLSRCILAPTNHQVNKYNKMISDKLGTELKTYFATDTIKEAEQAHETRENPRLRGPHDLDPSSLLDYYVSETPPGLPSYRLQLRKGAICRIMRNFSIDKGLVKNTRVVITSLGRHVVAVKKLSNIGTSRLIDNEELLIPRITFTFNLMSGHTLLRRQFPLALAYASTFNSCQGLTLDAIGCDLTTPAFSHGQLYTALSRIKKRQDACLLFPNDSRTTTNVTYHELLL
jgi:ATP-dependent DNA helicase PIF1